MANTSQIVQPAPASVDVPSIIGLNAIMLTVMGWLGAWAFKQIVRGWEKNSDRLEKQIEELKESQAVFCDTYVRRDDYIRGMVGIDNKLDAIAKRQDEQFHMILDRLDKD
jgi:hypothetical protein